MIIHVKTVGTLKSLEEGIKVTSFTVSEGTSVSQVIDRLNLKNWEIGFIQINSTRATKESILKENDTLTLIAPLAGG
jgi:molybdopterin converting factor small subunit